MTPKEKAKEIFDKFYKCIPSNEIGLDYHAAKECALIAVDEILNQDKGVFDLGEIHYHFEYWHNVKQEIENL